MGAFGIHCVNACICLANGRNVEEVYNQRDRRRRRQQHRIVKTSTRDEFTSKRPLSSPVYRPPAPRSYYRSFYMLNKWSRLFRRRKRVPLRTRIKRNGGIFGDDSPKPRDGETERKRDHDGPTKKKPDMIK